MKVSVVVPNYNYAPYLKERLRSVLGQTVRNLELLYIDDASTDASNDVARNVAQNDTRMIIDVRETNSGGPYWTWNEAAARASGEWLWFAGADDTACPTFLEEMLSLAERHPQAGILRSDFLRMNGSGQVVDRGSDDRTRRWKDAADYAESGPAEIVYAALSTYATASSLLLRRDVFAACGGFDARIPLSADTLLYLRMVARSGTAYRARPLTAYRDHAGSVTRSAATGATEISKCFCMAKALAILTDLGVTSGTERRILERYMRFRLNSARCSTGGRIAAEAQWMVPQILEQVPRGHGMDWLRSGA